MKIIFPDYAIECLNRIESAGFEAWFVGGCVRDSIIGREFTDIDITTNAFPEQVESIFEKTVPTGKKHGTITVITDKNPIEVTTYRSEFGYDDNRHPNKIKYEKNISADLSRRDFTINALAYNPKRNMMDIFGGQNDLKNHVIKTVGNPNERFSEDALRILRAYRFASQLGYDIEENTEKAALLLSGTLKKLSGERVLSELKKLSEGKNPFKIDKLLDSNCLEQFGIGKFKDKPSNFINMENKFKAPILIFLCEHNISLIKEKLKADNKLIRQLEALDDFSNTELPENKTELKFIFNKYSDYIDLYLSYVKLMHPDKYDRIKNFTEEISEKKEPFLIKHLAIGGNELLNIGVKDMEIGKVLNKLILNVIENPESNNYDYLLAASKNLSKYF